MRNSSKSELVKTFNQEKKLTIAINDSIELLFSFDSSDNSVMVSNKLYWGSAPYCYETIEEAIEDQLSEFKIVA